MLNPFGLDFKDKSIAVVFATCVSCFDYALTARPNNRATLRLSVVRLRLSLWGEAVNIYHDPKLGEAEPHADDLNEAKTALIELITRFGALSASANDETERSTPDQPTNGEGVPPLLITKLDEIACKRRDRRQHPGLLETRALALGERTMPLVEAGSVCADRLEEFFPAFKPQQQLYNKEIKRAFDRSDLKVLQIMASDINHWISTGSQNISESQVNITFCNGSNSGLQTGVFLGRIGESLDKE